MVAEIYGGISAVKAAFDLAKGLKDIHDATLRNAAVIELQEQILTAQEAQTSLIQRIGELEKQVADFETWNTEEERYELKHLGLSAFAYMLKPAARGSEPPHFVCTIAMPSVEYRSFSEVFPGKAGDPGTTAPRAALRSPRGMRLSRTTAGSSGLIRVRSQTEPLSGGGIACS